MGPLKSISSRFIHPLAPTNLLSNPELPKRGPETERNDSKQNKALCPQQQGNHGRTILGSSLGKVGTSMSVRHPLQRDGRKIYTEDKTGWTPQTSSLINNLLSAHELSTRRPTFDRFHHSSLPYLLTRLLFNQSIASCINSLSD